MSKPALYGPNPQGAALNFHKRGVDGAVMMVLAALNVQQGAIQHGKARPNVDLKEVAEEDNVRRDY
jgi:hypothetical protein